MSRDVVLIDRKDKEKNEIRQEQIEVVKPRRFSPCPAKELRN